jgi:hypothetical protein
MSLVLRANHLKALENPYSLQQRDNPTNERHHNPIPAISNDKFPGRTAQLVRATWVGSTAGRRAIRQCSIDDGRLCAIDVRHANQAGVRIGITAISKQLRNIGKIAIVVAAADRVFLTETENRERLVAGARVVIGAVVVVHGVVPWVAVCAVEPEPGEEGERVEG